MTNIWTLIKAIISGSALRCIRWPLQELSSPSLNLKLGKVLRLRNLWSKSDFIPILFPNQLLTNYVLIPGYFLKAFSQSAPWSLRFLRHWIPAWSTTRLSNMLEGPILSIMYCIVTSTPQLILKGFAKFWNYVPRKKSAFKAPTIFDISHSKTYLTSTSFLYLKHRRSSRITKFE